MTGRVLFEDQYTGFREIAGDCFYDNVTDLLHVEEGRFFFPLEAFSTDDPIFRLC